jgi:excisionase family DNA binding protein
MGRVRCLRITGQMCENAQGSVWPRVSPRQCVVSTLRGSRLATAPTLERRAPSARGARVAVIVGVLDHSVGPEQFTSILGGRHRGHRHPLSRLRSERPRGVPKPRAGRMAGRPSRSPYVEIRRLIKGRDPMHGPRSLRRRRPPTCLRRAIAAREAMVFSRFQEAGMAASSKSDLELLTVGDAALLLGLSPDMVRVLHRQGRLQAYRTPRGVRLFKRKDVERLAQERRQLR